MNLTTRYLDLRLTAGYKTLRVLSWTLQHDCLDGWTVERC